MGLADSAHPSEEHPIMNAAARPMRLSWRWIVVVAVLGAALAAAVTYPRWQVTASEWWSRLRGGTVSGVEEGDHHEDEHEHEHEHDLNSIELTPQARRNIGLQTAQVERQEFERTITVPGVIVERPGRSSIEVTAPLTGVVEEIRVIPGEAVTPGQLLFEQRLTHEELVQAQGEFLRTAEELDVLAQEIARLERITRDGAVAGKTLLERQYEKQRHEAALRAQKEALRLHGFSGEQIDEILKTRRLLGRLAVVAPAPHEVSSPTAKTVFQVDELQVEKGQHVNVGETLTVLSDHALLFIEGDAFEQDIPQITHALKEQWPMDAILAQPGERAVVENLEILYLANQIDRESRAFHFYLKLKNELLSDRTTDGHRFINWRFKPGQRVELLVPVERLAYKLVAPAEAVVQDGVETFVFVPNGDHFERRPVHVESRNQREVVVADDGSLYAGEEIVVAGAAQLQFALKNQSGVGADPHAGHSH
jgi:multidrug efflux pump subunit AcrA (membrane-fusion protein)